MLKVWMEAEKRKKAIRGCTKNGVGWSRIYGGKMKAKPGRCKFIILVSTQSRMIFGCKRWGCSARKKNE
jgi:hypothetical protein